MMVEKNIDLVNYVQKLFLEAGKGFALVGRQHHIQVGGRDFYIDLLFFHIKLKCYVVVELKAQDFDRSHAGQLAFYVSAVDELVRDKNENPTIGLLLCKTKNNFVADYTLKGINGPIGIAEYTTKLTAEMKKEIKSNLPTIEEIEAELAKVEALSGIVPQKTKKITKK